MPKIGSITLQTYVNILKEASIKPLPNLHNLTDQKEKWRVVKELFDEGLLSDARISFGNSSTSIVSEVILTPQGASALVTWSDYLKQQTYWYKFGKSLLQLLWILVGAIATVIPDIIKYFIR